MVRSDINASTPLPWKMKTYIAVTHLKFVGENITLQVKDVQPNEEDSTNKSDFKKKRKKKYLQPVIFFLWTVLQIDKLAAEASLIKEIQELELGRWHQGFNFLVNSFTLHFIFHKINKSDYLKKKAVSRTLPER